MSTHLFDDEDERRWRVLWEEARTQARLLAMAGRTGEVHVVVKIEMVGERARITRDSHVVPPRRFPITGT